MKFLSKAYHASSTAVKNTAKGKSYLSSHTFKYALIFKHCLTKIGELSGIKRLTTKEAVARVGLLARRPSLTLSIK